MLATLVAEERLFRSSTSLPTKSNSARNMATGRHISLPKTFTSGDVSEWFKRFEICCTANEWNAATKALKLPTLLEGEALAIWLELSDDDQKD